MTAPEFDPMSFVALAFKTKDGFGKTVEFVRADLHYATERKLAKAVEALRSVNGITEASYPKVTSVVDVTEIQRVVRAALAEIEKV